MPSLIFWITLVAWVTMSTILYIRVLYVIKTTKNVMYYTFFFRQFFSQGLFDMSFFTVYVVFYTLPTSARLDLNGTILIHLQYLHTYYFLYAQVYGICMMSLNRLFIMYSTSRFSQLCEELPQWVVFFIQLIVPFLLIVHCFFQPEPYYILQNENAVRINEPGTVIVNATQAGLTTSLACALCAVSYIILLRKLFGYSKTMTSLNSASGKFYKKERAMSAMAFTLFIALCVLTAFYVTVLVGVLTSGDYLWAYAYYTHIIALVSFMNPWSLIATNSETRKSLIRIKSQSTALYTTSMY